MSTFLLTFSIFIVFILAMSLGYIFKRKVVKGSCGGLGAVGIDKVCDCPEPCDVKKKRQLKERLRAENIKKWQRSKIG